MVLKYAVWKNGKILKEGSLKDCRVTASENAASHQNLPNGVFGGYQSPIDLALWPSGGYDPSAEYKIYCEDERVDVIQQGTNSGNYVGVRGKSTGVKVLLVHVNMHNFKPGEVLSEGSTLARIAPKEENGGYAVHLHLDMSDSLGRKTRDLLYNPIVAKPEEPEEPCKNKLEAQKAQYESDLEKERVMYSELREEKVQCESLLRSANAVLGEKDKQIKDKDNTIKQLNDSKARLEEENEALKNDKIISEGNLVKHKWLVLQKRFQAIIDSVLTELERRFG